MTTENKPNLYTFSLNFLDAPETALQVIFSATLDLTVPEPGVLNSNVTGTLSFGSGGIFTQPVDLTGSLQAFYDGGGILVSMSGSSTEMEISLNFIYVVDGSAGGGENTLLGGMVSLLGFSYQETNPYIIQGVAPQM